MAAKPDMDQKLADQKSKALESAMGQIERTSARAR